jgi:tetratricopeptide (TPR) repeat protein
MTTLTLRDTERRQPCIRARPSFRTNDIRNQMKTFCDRVIAELSIRDKNRAIVPNFCTTLNVLVLVMCGIFPSVLIGAASSGTDADVSLAEANQKEALASRYYKEQRFAEGVELQQRVVEIREKLQPNEGELAGSLDNLGFILKELNRPDEALSKYARAAEIFYATNSLVELTKCLGFALEIYNMRGPYDEGLKIAQIRVQAVKKFSAKGAQVMPTRSMM